MNSPFFFLHIPKTAGTTLNTIFDNNLSPNNILDIYTDEEQRALGDITYDEIARFRLIRGHLFIKDFSEVLDGPVPFRVFTYLRDPVKRIISEYHFLKRWPKSHLYDYLNRNDISLIDYVTSDSHELRYRGRNGMVGSLSGINAATPDEGVELAMHNLKDRFMFFGILERFDESLLMLKRLMGLENVFYEKQNVQSDGVDKTPSQEELDIIRENNEYDIRLYEQAVVAFDERVTALGPEFQSEVRMFGKVNLRFQRVSNLINENVGVEQGTLINPK